MLSLLDDLERAPAACRVMIDRQEIIDLYPSLVELNAMLTHRGSAEATLKFEARRLKDGSWSVQDDERIRPWAEIEILATFGQREEPIFQGFIRQVKAEYPEQRGSVSTTVVCQDTALLLDRTQRQFRWGDAVPITDGQIISTILGEASIAPIDSPGEGFPDLVVSQNESDIKFIKRRADANNYDMFFREGALYFGPMRFDRASQAPIAVYAGTRTHCISFSLDDDGHHPDTVIYEVATDSGDQTSQQTVTPDLQPLGRTPVSTVSASQGPFAWRLAREGLSSDGQARRRAQARANEESLKIKANGELDGALYGHVLLPGEPVTLDGVGDKYGGRWYVTKVDHGFDSNGYRQNFEVVRNAYGDDTVSATNPIASLL